MGTLKKGDKLVCAMCGIEGQALFTCQTPLPELPKAICIRCVAKNAADVVASVGAPAELVVETFNSIYRICVDELPPDNFERDFIFFSS